MKKPNGFLVLSVLFAIIILLINLQHLKRFAYKISSDFFYTFLEVPNVGSKKMLDVRLMTKSKEELAVIAQRYIKDNNKLLAELASIEDLRTENKMLRDLLSIPERADYKYVFAELLTRDPAFWDEKFTINKGRDSGIIPGSPVLTAVEDPKTKKTELAIVGRVRDVTNHTAVISTIFSQDCKLSVRLSHSKVTGIIHGGGRKGSELWANIEYLPRYIDYKAGEAVYTSGASRWTPSSLYVGRIMGKNEPKIKVQNNLYIEAQMRPEADINDIKFVMIMVKQHK